MDFPEGAFAGVTALMLTYLYALAGIVFLLGSVILLLVRYQYFQFTKAWFIALLLLFAPVPVFFLLMAVDPMGNSTFWEWMDYIYFLYPVPAVLTYVLIIKNSRG